jgi:hypothetical protein
MGYYLLFIWKKTNPRAWFYEGNDSFFNGNIKIGHGKLWLVLGIVLYFSYGKILFYSKILSFFI